MTRKQIASDLFDHDIRIDHVIWLSALSDKVGEQMEEFLLDYPEDVTRLFGLTPPESRRDFEGFTAEFYRSRFDGYLVKAVTPVPTDAVDSGYSSSWGYYTSEYFYFPTWDEESVAVQLIAWQELLVDKARKEAKPKRRRSKAASSK